MAELRLFGRARRRAWRKASWPCLARSERAEARGRARRRRRPWRCDEALVAGAGRNRDPGQDGRLARPPTCSPFRSRCCPTTSWSRPAFERSQPARPRPRPGRPRWTPKSPAIAAARTPISRARTADLEDIRDRVLGHLAPGRRASPHSRRLRGCAADLPLSRFLAIDWAAGRRDRADARAARPAMSPCSRGLAACRWSWASAGRRRDGRPGGAG